MKRFILVGILAFFSCGINAFAVETHASLTGSMGYDFLEENSLVKAGMVLSAPIGSGFGWWSYTGVGSTVKDQVWAAHSQGVDWSFNRITSGVQITVSKDPDHFSDQSFPVTHTFQVNTKVKLW